VLEFAVKDIIIAGVIGLPKGVTLEAIRLILGFVHGTVAGIFAPPGETK
jgi:hypothetical protein